MVFKISEIYTLNVIKESQQTEEFGIQWNLRITDTLGTTFLCFVERLSLSQIC